MKGPRIGGIFDKRFAALCLLVVLLVFYGWMNPLRVEHWGLILLFLVLLGASRVTRSLAVAVWPAAIFGFSYDLMRLLLNRSYDMAPSAAIYRLEAWLFGWMSPSTGALGPVDFFAQHNSLILDLPGGLWYSTHIPSVIIFGVYLWWRSYRENEAPALRVDKYFWGFLIFNGVGMACWALFPVAPPWYVEAHGLVAPATLNLEGPLLGSPAGLARVDVWLGTPHFEGLYKQSTYVFGAMPSLHAAAPIWVALWTRKKIFRLLAWGYALAMCFFAVYLTHHYVVDVLAGGMLAGSVYLLLERTRLGAWAVAINARLRDWLDALFGSQVVASEPGLGEAAGAMQAETRAVEP
ncbi:phosphatase PAP2 family protein [Bradymonas sediminis]|uniref:Inositolphosphotransferase Aur1/Ipt1 domain-containing protein n=1 Tax=Bradymonas sediminis TaxID=1548548 RepID=A0A2Z4FR56_9DELT|nr:phosphatase PAP2 family protein [Bradymonas sediminis]AWV91174.1 hypothetical protein DN745_18320 [Bradymonas sediminis]TDP73737.1 PAP2 superfamily protein [Bradymonas sediminis]